MKFQICDFVITADQKGTPNESTFYLRFEGHTLMGSDGGHTHFPAKSGPKNYE